MRVRAKSNNVMQKYRFKYILLLLLLFTGAGLLWGYNIWDAHVYFDNTNAQWTLSDTKYILFFPEKSDGSAGLNMSHIAHTNLLYWNGSWGDGEVSNARFASVTDNPNGWGWNGNQSWNRLHNNSYCFGMTGTVGVEDNYVPNGQNDSWLYISASGTYSNEVAIDVASSNHLTGGYSDLNHRITIKKYTAIDGNTYNHAEVNSGMLTISAYQMTAHGIVSNEYNYATIDNASDTSAYVDAVYTGEVTITAEPNDGYVFMGWFKTGISNAVSTTPECTFNARNSADTLYARFAPKLTVGKRIYLYTADFPGWEADNSRFAACFDNASTHEWVNCTKLVDHVYYVDVPQGNWGDVYLVRLPGDNPENSWTYRRNQSHDMKAYGTYNCVYISGENVASWRKYAPTFAVIGDMNEWDPVAAPMTDNEVTLTLAANQSYAFKVGQGLDETWYGYDASTDYVQTFLGQKSESPALTANHHNMRILTGGESGSYTFKWNDEDKTLTVEYPDTDKPGKRYVYYENTKKWRDVYAYVYGGSGSLSFPGTIIDSVNIGGKYYHYVALGDNTSVVFSQGDGTGQDDLKNITSYLGQIYQPSKPSWKSICAITFHNEYGNKIQDGIAVTGESTVTNYAAVQTKTGVQFAGWEVNHSELLINPDGSLCANVESDDGQYTDESGKWVYEGSPDVYPQWGHTSHISGVRMNGASEEDGEFGGWSSTSNTFTIYEGVGTLDIVLSANKEYRIAVHEYGGTSHVTYNHVQSTSDGVITLQAGDASDYISFSTGDHEGLCHFTYDFASHQLQINTRLHKVIVGASEGGMDVPYTDPVYNPETTPSVTSGNYYYEGYQFRLKPVLPAEGYYLIGVFEDVNAMGHRWASAAELPGEGLGNQYYAATVPDEDYSLYACYMQTGHIYFIGRDAIDPESWDSTANWLCGRLPLITDTATIFTPARVDIDHAVAKSIILDQSGRYPAYSGGTLTIQANKGLEVTGTIRKRTESLEYTPTSPTDLVLESSAAGNATLIFENSNSCQATVQMFSKGWTTGEQGGGTWNWQLAGVPVTDATRINDYYGGYMYRWAGGEGSGWVDQTNLDEVLMPFAGYIMSYPTAENNLHTYVIDGTLVATGDKSIAIPANTSSMVITNSWTAPIYVKNITFTNSEPANIYIFNTGYAPYPDAPAKKSGERFAAGTYHAVPVSASPYTGDSLIASMQGFYVRNKTANDGTINIDYNTVVRPSGDRSINAGQMHAPQRVTDDDNEDASEEEEEEEKVEEPVVLKIYVSDSQHDDRVILLEREDFSRGFDNGWDGEKFQINAVKTAPRLFAINLTGGKEEISAIPDIDGTVIGFRPGTESDYTISFDYNGEESLYLYDNRTAESTPIDNESIYAFASVGTNEDARFVIRKIPTVATGTEQLQGDSKPQQVSKRLIDGTLYIERAQRTYNIIGIRVK